MSKRAKYALLFIIIAIIVLGIYVGKQGIKTSNENKGEPTQNIVINNTTNNNITENTVVDNNTVNNTQLNTVVTPQSIVNSTTLSKEEKAKELAKQKWGGSEGVYFAIDTVNTDETYVVSVRDSATTKVLEWYTIDIKSGIIEN